MVSMNKFCLLGVLMLANMLLLAQNNDIQLIRNLYKSVTENADTVNEKTKCFFTRTVPGVGICTTHITFHGSETFTEEQASSPWSNNGEIQLRFIEIDYNISAYIIHVEYLYNENNELVFYYLHDTYNSLDKRLYFKDGNLIKSIVSNLNETDEVVAKQEEEGSFSEQMIQFSKSIIDKGNAYLLQYKGLYLLEKVEKTK